MAISEGNTRTNVTIPKELKKRMERYAKEQNRSFNNLVITILMSWVRSRENERDNEKDCSFL